jgi:hypothetical protein
MEALDQIEGVLLRGGIHFQRQDDQIAFVVTECGVTTAWFHIIQNGSLSVLVGEFGFRVPAENRALVYEFCSAVNYQALSFANLELNPENGSVQLRHVLVWPDEGTFSEAQLKWFLASSARIVANLSRPLGDIVFGSTSVQSALERVIELFQLEDFGKAADLEERASA